MSIACANCRYFRSGVSQISPVRYKEGLGECRRNAPRGPVHLTWGHEKELHVASMTPFPIVPADDWCGEHSAK